MNGKRILLEPSTEQVLACPMPENDARAKTVRDYLVKLLSMLWHEESEFSGKRPFGNSQWQYEVYEALVRAELIEGEFDEDNYLVELDDEYADELILRAINNLEHMCMLEHN